MNKVITTRRIFSRLLLCTALFVGGPSFAEVYVTAQKKGESIKRYERLCRFLGASAGDSMQPAWLSECEDHASNSGFEVSNGEGCLPVEVSSQRRQGVCQDSAALVTLRVFTPDHGIARYEAIATICSDSNVINRNTVWRACRAIFEKFPSEKKWQFSYEEGKSSDPSKTGFGNYAVSIPLSIVPGFGLGHAVQGRWSRSSRTDFDSRPALFPGSGLTYTIIDGAFTAAAFETCRPGHDRDCPIFAWAAVFIWLPSKVLQLLDVTVFAPKLRGWWVDDYDPTSGLTLGLVGTPENLKKRRLSLGFSWYW